MVGHKTVSAEEMLDSVEKATETEHIKRTISILERKLNIEQHSIFILLIVGRTSSRKL